MSSPRDTVRRRDDEGDWHELVPDACRLCGCDRYVARDDPSLAWEAGEAWSPGCPDRACRCHADPVSGTRRP